MPFIGQHGVVVIFVAFRILVDIVSFRIACGFEVLASEPLAAHQTERVRLPVVGAVLARRMDCRHLFDIKRWA